MTTIKGLDKNPKRVCRKNLTAQDCCHLGWCIAGTRHKRPRVRSNGQAHHVTSMTSKRRRLLTSLYVPQCTEHTPHNNNCLNESCTTRHRTDWRKRFLGGIQGLIKDFELPFPDLFRQCFNKAGCLWHRIKTVNSINLVLLTEVT